MMDKRITYRRTMEHRGRRDSRKLVEYKWTRGGRRIRSGSAHHKFQLFSWPTFFSFSSFFWLRLALKDSPGSELSPPGPPNLSSSIPIRPAREPFPPRRKILAMIRLIFYSTWLSRPRRSPYYRLVNVVSQGR